MSAPSFLVLDIETIVDQELPQAGSSQSSGLPPPPFHQIVCIGVLWMDAGYNVRRLGIVGAGKSEHDALTDFSRFVGDRKPDLITYNGRGFDMPVIAARCLRHGVPFPHYYGSRDVRYRFTASGHLDLMDFLTDFGASRASRLDVIARSMGMPGKVGIEGKDVGPMVHAGKLAEVQAYCLCDVAQTAGVFLRVQLVRGQLSRANYLVAMQDLIDHIDADRRMKPVGDAMDRDRLLLRQPGTSSAPANDATITSARSAVVSAPNAVPLATTADPLDTPATPPVHTGAPSGDIAAAAVGAASASATPPQANPSAPATPIAIAAEMVATSADDGPATITAAAPPEMADVPEADAD